MKKLEKLTLQGYIVVSDDDLLAVLEELPNHIELTKREKGCLVFQVEQDPDNNNIFNVYEEFVDQSSFETHQERVKNSNWGKVTKNVDRHYDVSRGG